MLRGVVLINIVQADRSVNAVLSLVLFFPSSREQRNMQSTRNNGRVTE